MVLWSGDNNFRTLSFHFDNFCNTKFWFENDLFSSSALAAKIGTFQMQITQDTQHYIKVLLYGILQIDVCLRNQNLKKN